MSVNNKHLREACHLLLRQQFICPATHPTLFSELRGDEFAQAVCAVLTPLGYQLSWVGDDDSPEVYFCGLTSLQDAGERKYTEAALVAMRDQISACIRFFQLLDQAGNQQIAVVNGGELPASRLLTEIESSPPYRDQLRDLQGLAMFSDSRKAKDNSERLNYVLRAMEQQGYLVRRSSESSVWVFTGKLAYLQRIMGWLADHHSLTVQQTASTESGSYQESML